MLSIFYSQEHVVFRMGKIVLDIAEVENDKREESHLIKLRKS